MRNAKYSFKDFTRGFPMGAITEEIGGLLDRGIIPEKLNEVLTANDVNITNLRVSTVRDDRAWRIWRGDWGVKVLAEKVGASRRVFSIEKENLTTETDLSGKEIVGTCFYRESPFGETGEPMVKIFPDDMTGVTFRRCNLDNVFVPPGNIVITEGHDACCHRRIRRQNDLEDWIVDAKGKPLEPVNVKSFERLDLSIDPKDIPDEPLDMPITIVVDTVEDIL